MSEDVSGHYRGYEIKLVLTQLQDGSWTGNFTLIGRDGANVTYSPYSGSRSYPDRDTAKQEAMDAARREIDRIVGREESPSDKP